MKGTRLTIHDYHTLAHSKSYEWLAELLPQNSVTKTRWRCDNGHEFEAVYHNLSQGHGCPVCGYVQRSVTRRERRK
jgi:hypothetical protein